MKSHFFRTAFFVFTVSIILREFPGIKDLIETPYSGIETRNLSVQNIDASGPNAGKGILRGDEIVSVAGHKVRNYNHFRYLVRSNRSFEAQQYVFRRDGETIRVSVDYTRIPNRLLQRRFKFLLVAFTFLLMAVFVYLKRRDLMGGLFSLTCILIAFLLTDRPVVSVAAFQLFGELFHDAAMLAFPAIFLAFFMVFPDRYKSDGTPKRLGDMSWLFIVPGLLFLFDCYLVCSHFFYSPAPAMVTRVLLVLSTVYVPTYMIASLVIFVRNYLVSPVAQKLRLRIVIAGTIVGTVPFLFTLVLRQISPGATSNTLDLVSAVSLGFISVSFAYAILKHGAIELHVVARKSLVYAILTGVIIALYYMLVNVLGDYFTREFRLSRSVFTFLSVLVIAIVFAPARGFLQHIIDRIFFMEEYVYKKEVVDFSRRLSKKLARRELVECFFEKVENLLKPSHIAVYWKGSSGSLELAETMGEAGDLPASLSAGCFLAGYLTEGRKSLMLEYVERGWRRRYFDRETEDFVRKARASVCLRLAAHDAFLGIVVMGGKRTPGRLYKKADVELLETLSEHLGLVLENAELHEESIEKERLKNEVMLARDIQLSMLPESPPELKTFELVGRMMSSSEVGGDYYDYFVLDRSHVGVAMGDVSGKGIPAAMLMFSIQAVFKSLAVKERLSPAEMNNELNRYLCANAKPGQFATFFYGILDTDTDTFTFSNAGQHPALLFRREYTDRLGEGGTLLGIDRHHCYEEGTVRIGHGELLCIYTDGLVEQKNAEGIEFGVERLEAEIRRHRKRSVSSLLESLFASIVAYGEGAQDDDITCIILSNQKH